jgi:hypothetical protein
MLEIITSDYLSVFSCNKYETYVEIVSSLNRGLASTDSFVISCCCNSIDNISTHVFKDMSRQNDVRTTIFSDFYKKDQKIFQPTLISIFQTLLSDEENLWSLSRPLYSLILIMKQVITLILIQVFRL